MEEPSRDPPPALSWRLRGLLALAFTALWYVANGYRVGVEDHTLLIPLAEHALDPEHLRGDYLFGTTHPTFLWRALAPFVALLGVEPAYALVHALCVFGLGLAILALTRALAGAPAPASPPLHVGILALALAAPTTATLAAIPACDNLLLPRVVSLAPLLFALALAARGRLLAAFALVGLVFNIHPTTAAHAAVLVGSIWLVARAPAAWALARGRPGAPALALRALAEPGAFLVAGLPMLLQTVAGGDGFRVRFPFTREWYDLATLVFPYHHFPERFPLVNWALGLLPWGAWLGARIAGFRARAADVVMIATPLLCGLGYLLIEVVRLPQAVALHVFESTRFASYLAPVLVARWAVAAAAAPTSRAAAAGLAAGALYAAHMLYFNVRWSPELAAFLAPAALPLLGLLGRLPAPASAGPPALPGAARRALAAGAALVVLLITAVTHPPITLTTEATVAREYADFAVYLAPPPEGAELREFTGLAVMEWAREGLPEDALVAIPPSFFHPLVGFRLIARRAIFASWKDGGEAYFSETFADAWRERIERLGGAEVTRPFPPGRIDFWEWAARSEEAVRGFHRLGEAELRARSPATTGSPTRCAAPISRSRSRSSTATAPSSSSASGRRERPARMRSSANWRQGRSGRAAP
jgi:hypothetical protein